jgi:hypothetical protein
VNKFTSAGVPVIESRCCAAPSTTMNPVISDAPSRDRRCVRCRQVFCRIEINDSDQPLKVAVGAQAA